MWLTNTGAPLIVSLSTVTLSLLKLVLCRNPQHNFHVRRHHKIDTLCVIVFIITDTNKHACFVTKSLWILGNAVCCQYLNVLKQPSQDASFGRMTASINILLRKALSLRLKLAVTDLPHLHAFYWCALLCQAHFCRWPEYRASSSVMHFAKREMVELSWHPLEEGC